MTYDQFVEACNRGTACPSCFTTHSYFIIKIVDPSEPPFCCVLCDYRFAGHEFVDHAKVAA